MERKPETKNDVANDEGKERNPETKNDVGNDEGTEPELGASEQQSASDQQQPRTTNPVVYSLKIGFFAGVIWGALRWLSVGLHFTKIAQAFLIDPFVPRKWLSGFGWQALGYGAFILMSVFAGLLYYALFGRLRGPWPGIVYGTIWWAGLIMLGGPLIGAVPPLRTVDLTSIITECCLSVVWGLFIGYSIAFEFHDDRAQQSEQKQHKQEDHKQGQGQQQLQEEEQASPKESPTPSPA